MVEIKHQVFISSTYVDLKEERRKILDILLLADCIPAGMEAFVATDSDQFDVIKKVIDLCDYYVLIIGMRYGSVNPSTELSYTEMEYEYAIEKGLPILVFVIDDINELPEDKCEQDPVNIEKLKQFKRKAMKNRLASTFKSPEELTGKVAVAIMKAKNDFISPGWQRGTDFDEISFRREIMNLNEEKKSLKKLLAETKLELTSYKENENLNMENHFVELSYLDEYRDDYSIVPKEEILKIKFSLSELFLIIGTNLLNLSRNEEGIGKSIQYHLPAKGDPYINKQDLKKLITLLYSQDLIQSDWVEDKSQLYWQLTSKGDSILKKLIINSITKSE